MLFTAIRVGDGSCDRVTIKRQSDLTTFGCLEWRLQLDDTSTRMDMLRIDVLVIATFESPLQPCLLFFAYCCAIFLLHLTDNCVEGLVLRVGDGVFDVLAGGLKRGHALLVRLALALLAQSTLMECLSLHLLLPRVVKYLLLDDHTRISLALRIVRRAVLVRSLTRDDSLQVDFTTCFAQTTRPLGFLLTCKATVIAVVASLA